MELNELRRIAEAEETQKWGGWAFEEDDFDGFCIYINDGDNFGRSYVAKDLTQGESEGESTAKFIATFDPPTVLALLSRLEQAERELVAVKSTQVQHIVTTSFETARAAGIALDEAVKLVAGWLVDDPDRRAREAEQAVQRVRELHSYGKLIYPNGDEEHYCTYDENAWPCETIRALDGDGRG